MTKNPAFESATAVLLDYVEDTELFADAMNESGNESGVDAALLDGKCNFLREPTFNEFRLMRAILPADGAARFLAAFESVVDRELSRVQLAPQRESAEAM